MWWLRLAIVAMAASFLASGPALTQETAATPETATTVDPLTVTAPKKLSPPEMEALASKFARSLGQPSRLGQVSRWMTQPCPQAIGLPDAFDRYVEARITAIAGEVGAPPAKAACRANNIFVLFTDKPQQVVDAVEQRRAWLLGFHYAAQTRRLTRFEGPIQAWYATATGGRAPVTAELDEEFRQMPGGAVGSRISEGLASHIVAVLVVVDSSRVGGQSIGRIAEEIALLSLARAPGQDDCHALPTILDARKEACPQSAALDVLSDADRAYLKALYAADPTLLPSFQQGAITLGVKREITGSR